MTPTIEPRMAHAGPGGAQSLNARKAEIGFLGLPRPRLVLARQAQVAHEVSS